MARIKGNLTLSDGCSFVLDFSICSYVLRALMVEVLSDLNRLGTWQNFGGKGYITPEDLAEQYCNSGGFQRFVGRQSMPSFGIVQACFVRRNFVEFQLVVPAAKRTKISTLVWSRINQALWKYGRLVICSKEAVNGWPKRVLLGTHVSYPQQSKEQLAGTFSQLVSQLTGRKEFPYKAGKLYGEDLPNIP